ncbi:MAG: SRPBCC domain-containing protein [Chloroflexota bacterium]
MKELRTEIELQATPEKVWQILTSFDKYPEWNPFIHHAIGKAEEGEKVDITFKSRAKEMTLHCTVIKSEPNRELCWRYHVGLPFIFQGEHSFIIESAGDNRVHFINREVFTGLLVPSQAKDIDTNSRQGFEAMDKALKARAETSK